MFEQNTRQPVKGMPCPIDGTPLSITDRQGIEIDYCPQCRGVWLDRGELDKLIERSLGQGMRRDDHDDDDDDRRQAAYSGAYNKDGYNKRKRRGFLGDLFDFD